MECNYIPSALRDSNVTVSRIVISIDLVYVVNFTEVITREISFKVNSQ